jgi:hypothetical protein
VSSLRRLFCGGFLGLLNFDQSDSSRENAPTSQLEEEFCVDPKTMVDFEHLF